jgi:hypothetical protein
MAGKSKGFVLVPERGNELAMAPKIVYSNQQLVAVQIIFPLQNSKFCPVGCPLI